MQASGAGVFLLILRNFQEHLFYRTPLDDCFCNVQLKFFNNCNNSLQIISNNEEGMKNNMKNIFLEKSYNGDMKIMNKTEKQVIISLILCQIEVCRNILKLSCRPLASPSYKFLKNKKKSGTSLPASFSALFFEEKYFFFIWY